MTGQARREEGEKLLYMSIHTTVQGADVIAIPVWAYTDTKENVGSPTNNA